MITKVIEQTEGFFQSLGVKTRLSDYQIGDETIAELAQRFTDRGAVFGEKGNITPNKVIEILNEVK